MFVWVARAVVALHASPGARVSRVPRVPAASAVRVCSSDEAASIRVNKALRATHSRREADRVIDEGRVLINGVVAENGARLARGDEVHLDGALVDWERLNTEADSGSAQSFVYVKYWKPRNVECTTDRRKRNNIIDVLGPLPGVTDRIYPVGRLDVNSTGLILLTSDGSIVNGVLRKSEHKTKEYVVGTNVRASDAQLGQLARGVTITTVAQRDGRAKPLTAPTLPCTVRRVKRPAPASRSYRGGAAGAASRLIEFVIREGRNRQIRKMCKAVGLRVDTLHRVGFAGITLQGCGGPGDWAFLSDDEIALLRRSAASAASPGRSAPTNPSRAPGRSATRGPAPARPMGGARRRGSAAGGPRGLG